MRRNTHTGKEKYQRRDVTPMKNEVKNEHGRQANNQHFQPIFPVGANQTTTSAIENNYIQSHL